MLFGGFTGLEGPYQQGPYWSGGRFGGRRMIAIVMTNSSNRLSITINVPRRAELSGCPTNRLQGTLKNICLNNQAYSDLSPPQGTEITSFVVSLSPHLNESGL